MDENWNFPETSSGSLPYQILNELVQALGPDSRSQTDRWSSHKAFIFTS
jgi:hypothetical protein